MAAAFQSAMLKIASVLYLLILFTSVILKVVNILVIKLGTLFNISFPRTDIRLRDAFPVSETFI